MKIPSREEIYKHIITNMQTSLKERGETMPLSSRSVWSVLAGVLAQAISIVYTYGAWVYRQIFPQTQDETALLLEGERFGEFPKPATQTKIKTLVTGQAGSIIPAGWQASIQNQLFEVVDQHEITLLGEVEVTLISLNYGALPVGEKLTFTRSLAGVENELIVLDWLSGSDKESISEFRNRMISLRRNRPQGGSISDYIAWSREIAGITRVLVLSQQAGIVVVYPLFSQKGENRIPSEEKRRELELYLNQEDLAPLGVADVMVGIFTELVVDIVVHNIYPSDISVRNTINQAWSEYLWERFPRQFKGQENTTETISEAEMLALAVSSGARQIEITLTIHGELIHVYDLRYNEIVRLGVITWNS